MRSPIECHQDVHRYGDRSAMEFSLIKICKHHSSDNKQGRVCGELQFEEMLGEVSYQSPRWPEGVTTPKSLLPSETVIRTVYISSLVRVPYLFSKSV